ncbi:glycosyltransferase family 4 protein [Acetobacter cibinongensis]|uniref:glycosyltransferase family 4 protein n=1 Tax=Acetobacter cibinongensis TaxID=146475 RepID=UPI000A387F50|nr:glycosyltransferase family 4 protein [Acetobacter cibinongensis]
MTEPYVVPAHPSVLPGYLDLATRTRIVGWAQPEQGGEPAALQILDNGKPLARIIANQVRPDVARAGFGESRCGFDLLIPAPLPAHERHVIQVRRESDGSELNGSPVVIEAAKALDEDLQRLVRQVAQGAQTHTEREDILAFLADVADKLLVAHARTESGQEQRERYNRLARRFGPAFPQKARTLRALIIDENLPMSGRDAGSQAILSHARSLKELGYDVSFVAARDMDPDRSACGLLEQLGLTVWRAPHYACVEDILRRQSGTFDVVYLHRIGVATRYLALARHYQPAATVLYSVADLHHRRMNGQAALEKRPELLALSRSVRLQECTAAWQADGVVTHSPEEEEWLTKAVPQARIACVPWAIPVRSLINNFEERRDIAFIGNYSHAPNLDAARWFVETILPDLRVHYPALTFWLVGADLPPHLCWPEGVRVMGHVEDLDKEVLDRVRLTVAPLRFGAGIKGKVLESFAAGVPCVMTQTAAEGLKLPRALASLATKDDKRLKNCILKLYADPKRCQDISKKLQSYVAKTFSEKSTTEALHAALKMATRKRKIAD